MTAIDWPNPRPSKLEKIRFEEETAGGYKKENEGSPLLPGRQGGIEAGESEIWQHLNPVGFVQGY